MLEPLDTRPFSDADLWKLGREENWGKLKRILAPIIDNEKFAVTELKQRLLIDDIRRRFDSSKDSFGYTILAGILCTNATDKKKMAEVADLVLSLGVHPDLPDTDAWIPAHVVGAYALYELVPTVFACRPDMSALNNNNHTPLEASRCTYVSRKQKPARSPTLIC